MARLHTYILQPVVYSAAAAATGGAEVTLTNTPEVRMGYFHLSLFITDQIFTIFLIPM